MSFLEKARAKAEQAAQQARDVAQGAAQQAASSARSVGGQIQDAAHQTQVQIQDPANRAKARETLQRAKRGVSTAIDRIDPNVLADVIIKATALQERTNSSLRAKGSVYRVQEVVIGASIPPTINFSIARISEAPEDIALSQVASTDLVAGVTQTPGSIQALDGSTIDEASLLEDGDEIPD